MSHEYTLLSKELIDEYYEKLELKNKLSEETKILSKKIKHEMAERNRKEIFEHGYKIWVESKFESNDDFFAKLKSKGLECLITPTISATNLKKALKYMNIDNGLYYKKYAKEKDSKWLYVKKIE